MLNIYIDADACPVKAETYKVATRYQLKVIVVANQYINIPLDPNIHMEVVSGDFDAADDWITNCKKGANAFVQVLQSYLNGEQNE